ncbi:MAG: protein kinase [Armatimonas sp.]
MRLGRYEIRREIARSNDIVWEGFDPQMNRRVAVKELLFTDKHTGAARRERIERFFREARAAGQLSHPNIVTIHEVSEDSGRYFIAMEFLDGQTLRQRMNTVGAMPLNEALRIATALADALAYAHARGVVHRDIKPDNVHLIPGGQIKLTDFGIARILGETQLTVAGQVFGTPSYMSPEQVRGTAIGPYTDVFSLGVLLWEMIAGRKPFSGDSVETTIYKIMNEPTPPLPGASPALEAVIRRATAKDPNARFRDAGQLRDALVGTVAAPTAYQSSAPAYTPPVAASHMPHQPAAAGTMMYGARTQLGVAPGLAPSAHPSTYQAPVPAQDYSDPEAAQRRTRLAVTLFATVVVLGAIVGVSVAVKRAMHNFNLTTDRIAVTEDMNKGVELYNAKKFAEAAAEFQRLRRGGNVTAATYEAYCYRQLGQEAQNNGDMATAKRYYDQALTLDPDDSRARTEADAAGKILNANSTPPPSLATPEPSRTTEFPKAPAPGSPNLNAKDFQNQNSQLQQAAARELAAGDTAWQQGKKQEAYDHWTQAIVAGPGTPASQEANNRLMQYGGQ